MTACTNCDHPKDAHEEGSHAVLAGGACSICRVIADPNIVSCTQYSTTPGGGTEGDGLCTGLGGHKKFCSLDSVSKDDPGRYEHFHRHESVKAIEAYAEKVAKGGR